MSVPLRLLLLEDSALDAELELAELARVGYACDSTRVQMREAFLQALVQPAYDLILADYNLPGFDGMSALSMARAQAPDIPFILVSGGIGEDLATESLKMGATDHVLKTRLERLGPVVTRALAEQTERKRVKQAEQALHEANQRLQAVSARILNIQEDERSRIARELHDQIGQALTAVKIHLQALQRRLPTELSGQLDEGVTITDTALAQVRSLSLDLRPPQLDDLGLVAALRWHLDRQARIAGLEELIEADNLPRRLAPEIETACFRIAQEAITNIVRHSGAKSVRLQLRLDADHFVLTVQDDGGGFDVRAARRRSLEGGNMGLAGMEERAALVGGSLHIGSSTSGGTAVCATFPLRYAMPASR